MRSALGLVALVACTPGVSTSGVTFDADWTEADRIGTSPDFYEAVPQNVLMISVDTFRRDHIHGIAGGKELTPTLDALIEGGVVWADHSTCSNWTFRRHELHPARRDQRRERVHPAAGQGHPGADARRGRVPLHLDDRRRLPHRGPQREQLVLGPVGEPEGRGRLRRRQQGQRRRAGRCRAGRDRLAGPGQRHPLVPPRPPDGAPRALRPARGVHARGARPGAAALRLLGQGRPLRRGQPVAGDGRGTTGPCSSSTCGSATRASSSGGTSSSPTS